MKSSKRIGWSGRAPLWSGGEQFWILMFDVGKRSSTINSTTRYVGKTATYCTSLSLSLSPTILSPLYYSVLTTGSRERVERERVSQSVSQSVYLKSSVFLCTVHTYEVHVCRNEALPIAPDFPACFCRPTGTSSTSLCS